MSLCETAALAGESRWNWLVSLCGTGPHGVVACVLILHCLKHWINIVHSLKPPSLPPRSIANLHTGNDHSSSGRNYRGERPV